jgi:hypothetical protein
VEWRTTFITGGYQEVYYCEGSEEVPARPLVRLGGRQGTALESEEANGSGPSEYAGEEEGGLLD